MTTSTLAELLAALAFLGTVGLTVLLAAFALRWAIGGRLPRARYAALGAAAVATAYAVVLTVVSLTSREVVIPPDGEKYFCELDCHLAYRVVSVAPVPEPPGEGRLWVLTVQARFDETTISARRPLDATLAPTPRRVLLRTSGGGVAGPLSPGELAAAGIHDSTIPMDHPLRPAESYRTSFWFRLPPEDRPAALQLEDDVGVSRFLIGNERSPWHAKVLLALPGPMASRE